MSPEDASDRRSPRESAQNLVRATGGGLLIGLPLLFTQEVWYHGFVLHPLKILFLLGVAFVVVVGYNVTSGFREDGTLFEVLVDSVEAMGLGILVALVALFLLGRLEADMSLREVVGKVALEAIPIAFGASLARSQLASSDDDEDDGGEDGKSIGPFGRLFVAAGGALLFSLNVAPTDEPVMLGIEADWWLLLLLMVASILLTFALVFYADFRGGRPARAGDSPMDQPLSETLAAYAISLGVSVLLFWSFDRTEGTGLRAIVGMTVVLGFVASLGAAVGRLLVGGGEAGAPQGEGAEG
ncbi:MAG: TIGR02587 family membrane protein [Chloroflexi bacterium]|nr:TIGR02587 family membrane protein [Chloroflexota bacterium]